MDHEASVERAGTRVWHLSVEQRQPLAYVAAGSIYLLLASILFLTWLSVDHVLVLLLSLSTAVAGLVDLSVGWPRLRRGRDREARNR